MAKGGATKKIEDALKALDSNQLKKALYLTENNPKLNRHHQWLEEAARACLANKDNKAACQAAIKEARGKIQGTVTLPIDDDSIEGLEDYLTDNKEPEQKQESITVQPPIVETSTIVHPKRVTEFTEQKADDELYESCEECHVAVAASRFADVCGENPEEAGGCELIGRSLENEETEPVDWLKAMVETAEVAQGKAKEEMVTTLTELTDYLERRNSPFLKALEREVTHG